MKIVHLQHPYVPDMGYQENHLPFKQQEQGHDVHMITTDILPTKFLEDGVRSKRFETGTTVRDGVSIHRYRSITYDTEAATLPVGAINRIRQLNPDIIHSHRLVSLLSLVSPFGSLLNESKLFFDIHIDNDNFHLDRMYKKCSFEAFRYLVSPLLSQIADGFLPVNPHSKKFLQKELGIEESRIHLLPLGVDTKLFYPSEEERTLARKELGIDNNIFTAVTAGNLNKSKKVIEIVRAVNNIEEMCLLIIGRGPDHYISKIEDEIERLDISDRVFLHDFVEHENLSKYYNAADVGVWPGKLGITILEAIGCGLPVIIDESDATRFLVDNDNGLTVSKSSVKSIENKLERYRNNRELRESHRMNAIELVKNTLSWEAIAKESISLYKK